MHHVYTTRAIVIGSRPAGEANRVYVLLTRDLGLIRAAAQGVRRGPSKLKGHLLDLSAGSVSVVRGREYWRLTGAETEGRAAFLGDPAKVAAARNVFSLLGRLVRGEEGDARLFDSVDAFRAFLSRESLDAAELRALEALAVLRVLHQLGYFQNPFDFSAVAGSDAFSREALAAFAPERPRAVREINEALRHAGM